MEIDIGHDKARIWTFDAAGREEDNGVRPALLRFSADHEELQNVVGARPCDSERVFVPGRC